MKQKVLFIGLIWPEPNATAAGVRILQLVDFFIHHNYDVTFCSAAKKSDLTFELSKMSVREVQIELNNASFDSFIHELNPEIVVFDRFLTEEQFGWRVEDNCPKALKILDTEDLHFLRKSRLSNKTDAFFEDEIAKREIASIYRCDLSLIISDFELQLLQNTFNIPRELLIYLPFLEESIDTQIISSYPDFNDRYNFISIGNFKHEPNWKSVLKLKNEIWPMIREKLPNAELHVYGAYATQRVWDLHNVNQGFIIKGWIEKIETVYTQSRVCLAPLDYGAGIKGKLLNSMKFGTPNVTTEIGAEGMELNGKWNGYIVNSTTEFVEKAIKLYTNKMVWNEAQLKGIEIFNQRFTKEKYYLLFWKAIQAISSNLKAHRSKNFVGALLKYHHNRSTKFLSKYISLKNNN